VVRDNQDYSKVVLGLADEVLDYGFAVSTYRTTAAICDILIAAASKQKGTLEIDASVRVQRFGEKVFESVVAVSPYRPPVAFDL